MNYIKKHNEPLKEANEPAEYFLKVVALRDHYAEIGDPKVRRFFFVAYCNLVASLPSNCLMLRDKVFELYDQALELWKKRISYVF